MTMGSAAIRTNATRAASAETPTEPRRPPFSCLTADDRNAHRQFVQTLGTEAIWRESPRRCQQPWGGKAQRLPSTSHSAMADYTALIRPRRLQNYPSYWRAALIG
jgi:hypothetical protein